MCDAVSNILAAKKMEQSPEMTRRSINQSIHVKDTGDLVKWSYLSKTHSLTERYDWTLHNGVGRQ